MDPARQGYAVLHVGLSALPLVTGIDKFFDLLTDWTIYAAPFVVRVSPVGIDPLMRVAGIVEIAAGLLVALVPRIGAYVLAAWLFGIAVNLVAARAFYDVALRDGALALAAVALGRMSVSLGRSKAPS